MDRFDEIMARCEAAIQGPWRYIWQNDHLVCLGFESGDVKRWDIIGAIKDEATGEFIAAAREDVPYLLGEVDRLTASLAAMTAERDEYKARAEAAVGWSEALYERLGNTGGNESIRYGYSRWRERERRGPDGREESK